MLGKLLKYEFRAVGRLYLPLYALVLAFALANRVSSTFSHSINLPQGLLAVGYIMILTGLAIITFIFGITRFKTNLLGDEGYLMFTLPVSRAQLVLSKVISATVWTIIGGMIGVFSIAILAMGTEI